MSGSMKCGPKRPLTKLEVMEREMERAIAGRTLRACRGTAATRSACSRRIPRSKVDLCGEVTRLAPNDFRWRRLIPV